MSIHAFIVLCTCLSMLHDQTWRIWRRRRPYLATTTAAVMVSMVWSECIMIRLPVSENIKRSIKNGGSSNGISGKLWKYLRNCWRQEEDYCTQFNVKRSKPNIGLDENSSLSYGVLLAIRHKWTRPALTPTSKLVLDVPTAEGWKSHDHKSDALTTIPMTISTTLAH